MFVWTSARLCSLGAAWGCGVGAHKFLWLLPPKTLPARLLCSLIAAPEGIHALCKQFPRIKVITSEIDERVDVEFRVVPGVGNVSAK